MPDYDIVVVGAGMVGATIACGLAQQNFKVALLDKRLPSALHADEAPRIRVSAIHLASEQLLKNLGAWKYIHAMRSLPYTSLAVNESPSKEGFVGRLPDISSWAKTTFKAQDIGRAHLGHIIENDVIQLGLLESAKAQQNIDLLCPAEIKDLQTKDQGVTLSLADGSELHAELLIGADGAQSLVRQLSGIGQSEDAYDQHALVCSIRYKGALQTGTWQTFRPQGPLAFLPVSDVNEQHYGSLVIYDAPEVLAEMKALEPNALRRRLQSLFPKDLPTIEEVYAAASFPVVKSHALSYLAKSTVLAGDAAHTINPLAGQGVNLGFMDAGVLVEEIAKARIAGEAIGSQAVLKRYEKSRRVQNQIMMNAMDAFYYGFSTQLTPIRIARNIGLGLAQRSGPAKRKVLELASGLSGKIPRLAQVSD